MTIKSTKYTKWRNVKWTKWPKIYQHLPFLDPPIFTQIGIFGLKKCHLATLIYVVRCSDETLP
jgi:hypothetical protein